MGKRIYESMTKVRSSKWTLRIWRECDTFQMGPDPRVLERAAFAIEEFYNEPQKIVDYIEQMGRINDIEILNNEGDGACVYPDWP